MNKSDLVDMPAKEVDIPFRKAVEIVDKLFIVMSNTLVSGDRVEIRGFGSFQVKEYEGYTGRDPRTGEYVSVETKKLPFFKVGKVFKKKMDKAE